MTMLYFFIGVVLFGALEMLAHQHSPSEATDDVDEDVDDKVDKIDVTDTINSKRPGMRQRKAASSRKKAASSKKGSDVSSSELHRMGMITFVALFIHNIPEVGFSPRHVFTFALGAWSVSGGDD